MTGSCVDWQGLAARGGDQLSLALYTEHEHFIASLGLAPLPGPVWAKENMPSGTELVQGAALTIPIIIVMAPL